MATFLKCILALFILTGIAGSIYAGRELLGTFLFVKNAPERLRDTFVGYVRHEVVSTGTTSSPNDWGRMDSTTSTSYMSYPEFEFDTPDGQKTRKVGIKHHILERFTPGQQVEIIASPHGDYRLGGFYSLYSLDLCILALSLCFVLIPAAIWSVMIPSLKTPAGLEMAGRFETMFRQIADSQVGPVRVMTIIKGTAILIAVITAVGVFSGLSPFLRQLLHANALIESLEHNRFDNARELIIRKKGINSENKYGQTPLLLALEANRFDLARLLIENGARVNVKSKMYMTPLRAAAQSGDVETVRLLLTSGASPDAPEDETPPAVYAVIKGHDEIARLIIESGCDLNRKYQDAGGPYTIGDFTIIARKPELTEIVRRRGGIFIRAN